MLTRRWTPIEWTPEQVACWTDESRFVVNPAGRRSGKTEGAKRKIVMRACTFSDYPDGWFFVATPTLRQTVLLYWHDLKALSPPRLVKRVYEANKIIRYVNGAELGCVGMEKFQRQEGRSIDGCVLDEYAEMRPLAWAQTVRPGLSTRNRLGWAHFIGRPRGRNHFWDLAQHARNPDNAGYGYHHWTSHGVVPEEEIEAARRDMDQVLFEQEYEANFANFAGQAYYNFDFEVHCKTRLEYDPRYPLEFSFDFNVEPGVAIVSQTKPSRGLPAPWDYEEGEVTDVIGEVYVPRHSNTQIVCRRLFEQWSHHEGEVFVYGDATGGGRRTSALHGNDWQIVKRELGDGGWGHDLHFRVPRANREERHRVQCMNNCLMSAAGFSRVRVDPTKAPYLVKDLEGVCVIEGGSGEIDKKTDRRLTHPSDAFSYRMESSERAGEKMQEIY